MGKGRFEHVDVNRWLNILIATVNLIKSKENIVIFVTVQGKHVPL